MKHTKESLLRHAEVLELQATLYKGSPYGDSLTSAANLLRQVANAEPVDGCVYFPEQHRKHGVHLVQTPNDPHWKDQGAERLFNSPLQEDE